MDKHYIPNTKGVIFTNKNKFSFNIDSILLSYFSKVKKDKILIDIGSGTGIVGFRINFLNNLKVLLKNGTKNIAITGKKTANCNI